MNTRNQLWIIISLFFFGLGSSLTRDVSANNLIYHLHLPIQAQAYLPAEITFAALGDYGKQNENVNAVADMIKGWQPDFIITAGDNNYPDGEATTIDANVGLNYSKFIYPYQGNYTPGQFPKRFFPALGNHDWHTDNGQPFLDYFPINSSSTFGQSSGNERYYDFIQGSVHFFALNSNHQEPDGITADSIQAQWLKAELATSPTPWQIVYFHHSPFSSAGHGSNPTLQWPFAAWGADAIVTGHDHTYERLSHDGIPYFVNGLGGGSLRGFREPIANSQFRYSDDYGAMLIQATPSEITFAFYAITEGGQLIDNLTVTNQGLGLRSSR